MSDTQNEVVEDQYDALLRSMEEGLLIGLNNSEPTGAVPLGESKVRYSSDDRTQVAIGGPNGCEYQIHRDRRDELIYSEVTGDGLSCEDEVITIEVLGLDE